MAGLYYLSLPMMGRVAKLYRLTLARRARVVAVTGSFGKTTTARAIRAALDLPLDPYTGVTQPSFKAREVLRLKPADRHGVIECSIEAPGQMAFAAGFVRPDITVVTSIGSEHSRVFGTLEAIRNEKAEMVRCLPQHGLAVLDGDDPNVLWMKGLSKARVVTFGLGPANDIYATDVAIDWPHGTRFVLHMGDATRTMRIRLIGKNMVYAALAAIAVATAEGINLDQIVAALEKLEPTPGRLQPVHLANGAIILRDDFKSPLETIETALEVLSEIPAAGRIVVLGQISEARDSYKETQRGLGRTIARIASYAIFIGASCRPYLSGAARAGMDRKAMLDAGTDLSLVVKTLTSMLREGDVVLIKGRSSEKLDRVMLDLMGRQVGCTLEFCDSEMRCINCKMLARGWAGYPLLRASKNHIPAPIGVPSPDQAVERS
jgi:UDP-N-acetylmuramoyl-tripeptide--D-alanyl-D-alanine ligase